MSIIEDNDLEVELEVYSFRQSSEFPLSTRAVGTLASYSYTSSMTSGCLYLLPKLYTKLLLMCVHVMQMPAVSLYTGY